MGLFLLAISDITTTTYTHSYGYSYSGIPEYFMDSVHNERPTEIVSKIGVILPYNDTYDYSVRKVIPTIGLSMKYLAGRSITHGISFHFFFGDSRCSDVHGPVVAFDFYDNKGVNCFVGPFCDYSLSPVSSYASHWRLPIISPGGLSHDFGQSKLTEYTTLTRVGFTLEDMSMGFVNVMKNFGWKRSKVLYEHLNQQESDTRCFAVNAAMISIANKTDIHVSSVRLETRGQDKYEDSLIREVGLKSSGKCTHFVVGYILPMSYTHLPPPPEFCRISPATTSDSVLSFFFLHPPQILSLSLTTISDSIYLLQ